MTSQHRRYPLFRLALLALAHFVVLVSLRADVALANPKTFADLVQSKLLADSDAIVPGGTFTLGVQLKIKPHWHTYWLNPGEFGNPTRIHCTGPDGLMFGPIQWPMPTRIEHDGTLAYGYENEVLLMVPVTVAKDFKAAENTTIHVNVSWLSCDKECVEGGAMLQITLPMASSSKSANGELFQMWRALLPVALDHFSHGDAPLAFKQEHVNASSQTQTLVITSNTASAKVEWFPVANDAVAVEDIVVKSQARCTVVTFTPKIYKSSEIIDGKIDSVVVFTDLNGDRHAIILPIRVEPGKS